jgi:Tfp pilus assembly protein PilF
MAGLLCITTVCGCTSWQQGSASLAASGKKHETREPQQPDSSAKQADNCVVTAQEMERAGNDEEAIKLYEQARQLNPKMTLPTRRLAILHQRTGDFNRAIAEYRRAVVAAPKDASLLNDFGYCYYEQNNFPEAEATLRRALSIDSRHVRAWANLGLVLGRMECFDKSYEAFCHVVSPAEARSNIGVLLAQQGRVREAREAFQAALATSPGLKQAQAMLATLELVRLTDGIEEEMEDELVVVQP